MWERTNECIPPKKVVKIIVFIEKMRKFEKSGEKFTKFEENTEGQLKL